MRKLGVTSAVIVVVLVAGVVFALVARERAPRKPALGRTDTTSAALELALPPAGAQSPVVTQPAPPGQSVQGAAAPATELPAQAPEAPLYPQTEPAAPYVAPPPSAGGSPAAAVPGTPAPAMDSMARAAAPMVKHLRRSPAEHTPSADAQPALDPWPAPDTSAARRRLPRPAPSPQPDTSTAPRRLPRPAPSPRPDTQAAPPSAPRPDTGPAPPAPRPDTTAGAAAPGGSSSRGSTTGSARPDSTADQG